MQGIKEYIIKFEKTHNDTTEIAGVEMDLNPFFEQPKWINRVGTVVSVPAMLKTDIKPGYEVLTVHTSLLNESYKTTGRKESFYCVDVEKGYFRFEDSLVLMYREDSQSKWKCNGINIMVRPIPLKREKVEIAGLEVPDLAMEEELGYKGHEKQKGVLVYGNKELEQYDIKEGDIVCFKKDREYEFEIDGEILYHMDNTDLLMAEFKLDKTEFELSDLFN